MGFIKRAFDFVAHPSHSRTMGLVLMLILVVAVSLTVYVAQQQQQLRQRATDFCAEVTQPCSAGVTIGSDCTNANLRCRLGNEIIECK